MESLWKNIIVRCIFLLANEIYNEYSNGENPKYLYIFLGFGIQQTFLSNQLCKT